MKTAGRKINRKSAGIPRKGQRRKSRFETLESRRLLAAEIGVNIVIDPGFEDLGANFGQGVPSPWFATVENPFVRAYGGDSVPSVANKPPGGGTYVLYGGDQPASSQAQVIDLSAIASVIDQGEVYADLSAYIGGWAHEDDSGKVYVAWRNGDDQNLQIDDLGHVTADERNGHTSLLYREIQSIQVPIGTRNVYVEAVMETIPREDDQDNDGTVDNISLQLFFGDPHNNSGTTFNSDIIIPGDKLAIKFPPGGAEYGDINVNLDTLTAQGGDWTFNEGSLVLGTLTLENNKTTLGSNLSVQADSIDVDSGTLELNLPTFTGSAGTQVTASPNSLVAGKGIDPNSLPADGSLAIDIRGMFHPGNSPGVFNSGSLTFQDTTSVQIELDGPTAGASYDQINVVGSVNLGAANLEVILGYDPAPGQVFTILTNDGADSIAGTFAGLPEGAKSLIDGKRFGISYVGGDGNDVVLARNRPPESDPQTVVLDEDTIETFAASATDPDGDSITFSLVTPPTNAASFDFRSDGTFDYQGSLHSGNADSFTYSVTDGDLSSEFTINIVLNPVADAPTLAVIDVTGDEGTPIPLSITSALVDNDGSETLSIQLTGIPEGTVLNQGVRDSNSGNWDLLPADLLGLTIESPDNRTFDIGVIARATESNFSGNFDFAETTDTITVTVNNAAPAVTVSDQIAGSQLLREWIDLITITDLGYADTPSASVETFTYSIDWGDGSAEDSGSADLDHLSGLPMDGNESALTEASIDASHTYAEDGRYTVTVTVTDDDGASTVENFEVQVMIRLLDVTHGDESTTLLFTDPIDASSIDHSSIRVMGSQSGLVNDTDSVITVTGDTASVPLLHRGFAGERLTVILPADRDDASRTGVWSQRSNPIYQPEIDTYVVPATGGTGRWIYAAEIGAGSVAGDLNRDQRLDSINKSFQYERAESQWQWVATEHDSDVAFYSNLQVTDTNADGVLEPVNSDSSQVWLDADFDLDGYQERFVGNRFSEPTLAHFQVDGVTVDPVVETEGVNSRTGSGGLGSVGDFDGDGDQDVIMIQPNSSSENGGWLWLNPIRNPLPSGETIFELSSPAFSFRSDNARKLSIADFNNDGLDDIHVTTTKGIRVALSVGADPVNDVITWPLQHTVTTGQEIFASAIGDFDADGDVDLVSSYRDNIGGQWGTHLALNDGDGNFSAGPYYDKTPGNFNTIAGDFNSDGTIDLLLGTQIWLNPAVSQGAMTEQLEQYVSVGERSSGELGRWFDFHGEHGVTFEQTDFDVTDGVISFWNRDSEDNWSEVQAIAFPYDPDIGDYVEPYDLKISDDSAGFFYRDTASGNTVLQFYNLQENGTWLAAESFDWVSDNASVAIDSDQAVAIVNEPTANSSFASPAITYQRDGNGVWSENVSKRITNLDSHYDAPIVLQGNQLLIGQIYGGANFDGLVNVYTDTGTSWHLESEIENPAGHFFFGASIALDDKILAVGSQDPGPVFLYETTDFVTWTPLQTIQAPVDTYDDFGESLALQDGKLVIGNVGGIDPDYVGNVYIYQRNAQTGNFEIEQTLQSPNPQAQDDFGYVDFGDNELWIGAPRIDGVAHQSGYLFRMSLAAPTSNVIVTNTDDSGAGSLRAAIEFANSNPGPDTITFDIPGAGPHVIDVSSSLPTITDSVVIDGTSEPDYANSPIVQINATASINDGLRVTGGVATISGLSVTGFANDGIELVGGSGHTVSDNYLGIDPAGNADGNRFGLKVLNSSNNAIDGNVVSGNTATGVYVLGASATDNVLTNNYVGTDPSGENAVPNGGVGVFLLSANNTVGQAGAGNVISGNAKAGLSLTASATGTTIQGNKVGTNPNGTAAVPNENYGVLVQSGMNNIGGSYLDGTGNLFSGNKRHGLILLGASAGDNTVTGNFIGTNMDGTGPIPNTSYGIYILSSANNTIGTMIDGQGNLVSGNDRSGVVLEVGANGNVVSGNRVGASLDGMTAVPNGSAGVFMTTGSFNNTVNYNHIAGNTGIGVALVGSGTENNTIKTNLIGTNADGDQELGNGAFAVLFASANNTLGGAGEMEGNVIAGSAKAVVLDGAGSTGNSVIGNLIGVDQSFTANLGTTTGIQIGNGAAGNTIGPFNTVANNNTGLRLIGTSGNGNTITENSFFSNAVVGIDLKNPGPTVNDPGDVDEGPNRALNHPEIALATLVGLDLEIDFSVPTPTSAAAYPLTVEFFVSDGFSQGAQYLGETNYEAADAEAIVFVTLSVEEFLPGSYLTATATDADGNTSEFAAQVLVDAGVPVAVQASGKRSALDVSADGKISALDALMVINALNDELEGESVPVADVNGDGIVSGRDALRIINWLGQTSDSEFARDSAIDLVARDLISSQLLVDDADSAVMSLIGEAEQWLF